MRFFVLSLITVASTLACSEDKSVSPSTFPSGKRTESFGFNFRLEPSKDLASLLPEEYHPLMRDAAQRWERALEKSTIGGPDAARGVFGVRLDRSGWWGKDTQGDIGGSKIIYQSEVDEFFGEDDIVVYVVMRGSSSWFGKALAVTRSYYNSTTKKQYPVGVIALKERFVRDIRDGNVSKEYFYSVMVHELGHALGLNGLGATFSGHQSSSLFRPRSTACYFKGRKALWEAYQLTSRRWRSIKMDQGCGHWSLTSKVFASHFDVMMPTFRSSDLEFIESGRLISPMTLGFFEDLGYEVDYNEADDTERVLFAAGKRHVDDDDEVIFDCAPPTIVELEEIEE